MGNAKPFQDLLFMLIQNMESDFIYLENSNRKFKISIFMIFSTFLKNYLIKKVDSRDLEKI